MTMSLKQIPASMDLVVAPPELMHKTPTQLQPASTQKRPVDKLVTPTQEQPAKEHPGKTLSLPTLTASMLTPTTVLSLTHTVLLLLPLLPEVLLVVNSAASMEPAPTLSAPPPTAETLLLPADSVAVLLLPTHPEVLLVVPSADVIMQPPPDLTAPIPTVETLLLPADSPDLVLLKHQSPLEAAVAVASTQPAQTLSAPPPTVGTLLLLTHTLSDLLPQETMALLELTELLLFATLVSLMMLLQPPLLLIMDMATVVTATVATATDAPISGELKRSVTLERFL